MINCLCSVMLVVCDQAPWSALAAGPFLVNPWRRFSSFPFLPPTLARACSQVIVWAFNICDNSIQLVFPRSNAPASNAYILTVNDPMDARGVYLILGSLEARSPTLASEAQHCKRDAREGGRLTDGKAFILVSITIIWINWIILPYFAIS